MRLPDRGRLRALTGASFALLAGMVAAAVVPGTSSAFTAAVTNSSDRAAAKEVFTCADVFAGGGRRSSAYFEYALREAADVTTVADSSDAGNAGTYEGAHGKDPDPVQPCPNDPGTAYRLDGTSSRITTARSFAPIRSDFSIETWFKTAAASEKILGFEVEQRNSSGFYDKHLYVDDDGRLRFAVYNRDGDVSTATSPGRVNDGAWHQAVATTSSASGSVLYLDGVQVDATPKRVAEDFSGYWRIGEGSTGGWPSAPQGSSWFTGSLAFAAAYGMVLTADEVRAAYRIGRPAPTASPAPSASGSGASSGSPATAMPEATATASAAAPAASASSEPAASAAATPGSKDIGGVAQPVPTAKD